MVLATKKKIFFKAILIIKKFISWNKSETYDKPSLKLKLA